MAYAIGWYIEGEVVYVQYSGVASVEEMHQEMIEANEFLAQGTRPLVHMLVDTTKVTKASTLVEVAQAMKGFRLDPHAGWIITVGEPDKLVKFITSIARQIWRVRQRSFDTMDEAIDFLREVDGELDWNKAEASILTS
jgi:hypothetical protein